LYKEVSPKWDGQGKAKKKEGLCSEIRLNEKIWGLALDRERRRGVGTDCGQVPEGGRRKSLGRGRGRL